MTHNKSMVEVAVQAARAAGAVQRAHYGQPLNVDAAEHNDIKLEVDRLCEQAIVDTIRSAYPRHAILAEESGAAEGEEAYRWIIDPLDGTVNFFYGIPYFCTCVACYAEPPSDVARAGASPDPTLDPGVRTEQSLGQPVVGVVYAPLQEDLFVGVAGEGVTLNDEAIQASSIRHLGEAMVATGFGSTPETIQRMCSVSGGLVHRVRKVRCLGSAGYDMANVAAGRITGYYERGIRTWDVGAPFILLKEAGAWISASEYAPDTWDVLATAPAIHAALQEAIESDR